jgi:DNA-binding SARP family transcriptional activator
VGGVSVVDDRCSAAGGTSIALLGDLSVQIAGQDLTAGLGGRVSRLAFTFLLVNRERAVRRDELAAAVWEERAPADPEGSLRVVLSRLRRAIGAERVQGRAALRLMLPGPVDIDVERLRTLVGEAEAGGELKAARAAAALSAGELLPGLDTDWLAKERDGILELRLRALQAAGRAGLLAGGSEVAGATQAARAVIALSPYREGGHRLLIEALIADGEQAEALLAYENIRVLLRDELGTSPAAGLASLHMQLLLATDQAHPREDLAPLEQVALPPAAAPPVRPRLAGRRVELGQLDELWAAQEPGFKLALVEGDPGVGKSRLAGEFASRVHASGGNVLWGRCHEQSLVPYEPFVEVLRQYVGSLDDEDLAQVAHEAGAQFLSLAPDMARRLGGAVLEPVADDPKARRYRLFESVAEVLSVAAGQRGLMMVLEDLHWADQSTILLLQHLARRAARGPVLMLGTLRGVEVQGGDPIAPLLATEEPGAATWTTQLMGLTAAETGEMVAELAPDHDLQDRIFEETNGNPLFVVELVRAVLEEGDEHRLPSRVVEVIDRRLKRLAPDSETTLGSGAVLGRSFPLEIVARMTGLSSARLLDSVDELIEAGLVEEIPDHPGQVSFTHALIREVRYAQHSAARRRALHGAAAEAIEAIDRDDLDDHLGELAAHLEAAVLDRGSARSAVEALRSAGLQAGHRQAFEDATALLTRACQLFDLSKPSDSERLNVVLPLAESLRASGRIEDARASAAEAVTLAVALGDAQGVTRAALCFVGSHLVFKAGRPDVEDISILENSIAALDDGAPAQRVRLLARLCSAIYYSDRFDEVGSLSNQALELATREAVDDEALGWAHYACFWAALRPEGVSIAASEVEELVAIRSRAGSLELDCESTLVEWYSLLQRGRPDQVAARLAERREAIHAMGMPIYRWFLEAISAVLAVVQGRGPDAERFIEQATTFAAAVDAHDLARYAALPLLQLRRDQGREAELVEPLRFVVANNPGLPMWRSILLLFLVGAGETEEAQDLLAELARDRFDCLPRDVNWPWAMVAASESCVALDAGPVAEVLYGLISPLPAQSVVAGPALGFHGPLDRYLGPLAALLGRHEAAEVHFAAALDVLDRGGARPLAAATRLDHARALLLAGMAVQARERAGEALEAAEEMGLGRVRGGARVLLGDPV